MPVIAVVLIACSGSHDPTSTTDMARSTAVEPSPEPDETTETEPPTPEASDETDDDPNHPANRVARWRASLPPECLRHVREVVHDSERFAMATVWEGTGTPGGEEVCPDHNSRGIVASWSGTTPLNMACLYEQGDLGDVDGDSRMDLLLIVMGCAMSPPDAVHVIRDADAGPVLLRFPEGVSREVRSATWFPRDDGTSGVELVHFDWDTMDEYPPPEVAPVRLVWQTERLVRSSESPP